MHIIDPFIHHDADPHYAIIDDIFNILFIAILMPLSLLCLLHFRLSCFRFITTLFRIFIFFVTLHSVAISRRHW
jgi:hypothetical protein